MYVQLITFRLDGPTPEEFAALCDSIAPQYEHVGGLVGKVFLTDPDDDHRYGGVYVWERREDAEVYLRDGLARHLVDSPDFQDVTSTVLGVLDAPTAVAGGPLAPFAARAQV